METSIWSEILKTSIPFLTAIISFCLGLKASERTFNKQVKKDIYNNYYSEIIKLCYSLPSTFLLDFQAFKSYYHEDKISNVVIDNFSYIDPDIIVYWQKYNLALKVFNHECYNDIDKQSALLDVLNYHSHMIIKKSLKKSEKLSNELGLPQLSTPLLSNMDKTSNYENRFPNQEIIQKYHLHSMQI